MTRQELAEQLFDMLYGQIMVRQYVTLRNHAEQDRIEANTTQLAPDAQEFAEAKLLAVQLPWDALAVELIRACNEFMVDWFVNDQTLSDQDLQAAIMFFGSSLGQRFIRSRLAQVAAMEAVFREHYAKLDALGKVQASQTQEDGGSEA